MVVFKYAQESSHEGVREALATLMSHTCRYSTLVPRYKLRFQTTGAYVTAYSYGSLPPYPILVQPYSLEGSRSKCFIQGSGPYY